MVRASWLCACLAVAGCSFSLSGPPKDRRLSERPVCDLGKGPVVVDSVVGAGLGLGALASVDDGSTGTAVALGLLGAGFILAAASGSSTVDDCRTATASYESLQDVRDERAAAKRAMPQAPSVIPPPAVVAPPASAPVPVAPARVPAAPPSPRPVNAWEQFWKEVP